MEFMEIIMKIPVPVLLFALFLAIIVTVIVAVQYVKIKKLDGIRVKVYELILKAEKKYSSGEGKKKMKWCVTNARLLLPAWMQLFISDEALEKILQAWFNGVKDLLDDGKVNDSIKE